MTAGVLVVGYGNALRTDDGIGWHAAERLADDPRLGGATILRLHQLAPELALDFSRADFVVLIDASHAGQAGTFSIEQVERSDSGTTTWSHHLSPGSLIALADELYGRAPEVFLVSVAVESVELGDRLSRALEAVLPKVVDAVAAFINERVSQPRTLVAVVAGGA